MVDNIARPYEVYFKTKTGIKTRKYYALRSDRDREVARLRDAGLCKWIRTTDHKP